MNCSKCQTQNEENAQFCRNCGTNLHQIIDPKTDNKLSDTLLFIYIIIAVVSVIAQFLIRKFATNWYESPTKYIHGAFWILTNLSFILIPIAIKHKTLKIIGLIVTSILVIYLLYTNIEYLMS